MTEIERFQLEERIRIAYCIYQGDLNRVAKEVGADMRVVRKAAKKIREDLDADIKERAAFLIVGAIWQETLSNLTVLGQRMTRLSEVAEAVVSVCCKVPVYYQAMEDSSEVECYCTSCRKQAYTFIQQDMAVQAMLNTLNDQRIKEREFLTSFAKDMGLVINNQPVAPIIKQSILHIETSSTRPALVPAEGNSFSGQMADALPRDREHARKAAARTLAQLEAADVVDAELVDKKDGTKGDGGPQ